MEGLRKTDKTKTGVTYWQCAWALKPTIIKSIIYFSIGGTFLLLIVTTFSKISIDNEHKFGVCSLGTAGTPAAIRERSNTCDQHSEVSGLNERIESELMQYKNPSQTVAEPSLTEIQFILRKAAYGVPSDVDFFGEALKLSPWTYSLSALIWLLVVASDVKFLYRQMNSKN